MGLSTTKSLALTVLGLVCLLYCGYAAELATTDVIHTTLLSYGSADDITQTGGVFFDLSGASDQVFMYTVNPGVPYVMSWKLADLYNTSFVDLAQIANGTQITDDPNLIFRFYAAAADTRYMYLASASSVYKVDSANIAATAQNVTLTDFQQPTTLLYLSNATSHTLIVGAYGTTDLMTVNLDTFTTATKLQLDNAPYQDGATAHAKIRDDMGYLIYDTPTSAILAKVDLTASSLVPVSVVQLINIYVPDDAPSFYDDVNNILYMTANNATGPADAPDQPPVILIALNLTAVDGGTSLYNSTITVSFSSSKRAVGTFGDAVRAIIVSDESASYPAPSGLTVDVEGGQAFVMINSGVITRVNTDTFEVVTPTVIASSDGSVPGSGLIYKGTTAVEDRHVLAWTKNSIVTASVPTSCPNDCGETNSPASGVCVAGVCQCITGRHGDDCSGIACQSTCGADLTPAQGSCGLSGQCICGSDWTFASNCTARQCPNNCNGNGVCGDGFVCACNSQWAGTACELAASQACTTFLNEAACVAKTGACGWCMDTKKCVPGNLNGPVTGTCRAWYSGGKHQVGLLAAAIVFIVIFFLMLLVGIFSAMPMDYVIAGILVDSSLLTTDFLKEAYWRDERSSKTWKMFDLFQFISYYAFINVQFPTQLIQFTRYFNWANMMLPLPYGYEDNKTYHGDRIPGNTTTTTSTSRHVLNVEQYANSVKVNSENVFYGTMFWFAMLVCACLVVYGIYAFFMWVFLRKKEANIGTVLMQKLFYLLTRLVLIGYMPINITAAWHIRGGNTPHKGSIAAAVFAIIIFGILPIVFNAIVVWNKGKELLFLYLKLRFGALYSIYHYTKARFNLVVLIRKLAVSLLLGFLAAETNMGKTTSIRNTWLYAQVFTIVAVYVLYIIAVLAVRPYLDQVHLVLDIAMTTLFAVAFGVAILHRTSTSTAGQIVAGVCIILVFLACLLAFGHSWWNISGRNTYPWIMCGPKYGGLEEKEKDDDEEMDTAQVIKNKKQKEEALAGVMPSNKPGKAVEPQEDSSEVDSSLQSSSSEDEDEEEEAAPAEDGAEEDEDEDEDEESEEAEESE